MFINYIHHRSLGHGHRKSLNMADLIIDKDFKIQVAKITTKRTTLAHKGFAFHALSLIDTLESLQRYKNVVRLYGYCFYTINDKSKIAKYKANPTRQITKNKRSKYYVSKVENLIDQVVILVTKRAENGDLRSFLDSEKFTKFTTLDKLNLAMSLVASMVTLHDGNVKPMIHCDIHLLKWALSQYLVDANYNVLLADIDETPFQDYPSEYANITCRELIFDS